MRGACPELWRAVRSQPGIPLAPHQRGTRGRYPAENRADETRPSMSRSADQSAPAKAIGRPRPAVMCLLYLINLNSLTQLPLYLPFFSFPPFPPHIPYPIPKPRLPKNRLHKGYFSNIQAHKHISFAHIKVFINLDHSFPTSNVNSIVFPVEARSCSWRISAASLQHSANHSTVTY